MVRLENLLLAALSFGAIAFGGVSGSSAVSQQANQRLKRSHDHSNLVHRRHIKNDSRGHVSPPAAAEPLIKKKRASGRRCSARPSKSAASTSSSTRIPNNVAKPTEKAATTTKEAPQTKTTHKAAEPTKAASGGGGGGKNSGISWLSGTQSGDGTYYNIEGGYTACGNQPSDSDYIAAVSHLLFDAYPGATANPNANPICGKKVTAFRGGKSVTVTIVDRCTGCKVTDLDFTPAAFNKIADASLGRVPITWQWA